LKLDKQKTFRQKREKEGERGREKEREIEKMEREGE